MIEVYNNIYLKDLFENKVLINEFKLSNDFFKQFVRSNRESGFVLFMLIDLKNLLNSILKELKDNEENITKAYLIGYNNYNKIYLSLSFNKDFILKKQPYFRHAIIKNIIYNNNSLLLQIQVNKIEEECKFFY